MTQEQQNGLGSSGGPRSTGEVGYQDWKAGGGADLIGEGTTAAAAQGPGQQQRPLQYRQGKAPVMESGR